jgi:hypothetical protein
MRGLVAEERERGEERGEERGRRKGVYLKVLRVM